VTVSNPNDSRPRRTPSTPGPFGALRYFSTVPPRVLGHILVVFVCVVVAYAGRTNRLTDQLGLSTAQPTDGIPSALAYPAGTVAADALVRPTMVDTQSNAARSLQIMHYQTRPGDTAATLADKFDISVNTIIWTNNLSPDGALTPGQELVVLPVSGVLYSVQPGDDVASIAQRFQSDDASIALMNNLSPAGLPAIGTQLIIPGGRIETNVRPQTSSRSVSRPPPGVTDIGVSPNPPPAPPVEPAPTQAAVASAPDALLRVPFANRVAPIPASPLLPLSYSVVDGDTLTSIAARFGVSPDDLATSNGLQGSQDALNIDQKLVVPPVPGVLYVVQSGDTLLDIVARYGADVDAVAHANGLSDPYPLQVGQTLVVPGGKAPVVAPAPTAAPAAPTAVPATPTPTSSYTVQDGDSLASIADAFGADLRTIIDINGLADPYVLQPGQHLTIHGGAPVNHPVVAAPAPVAAPAAPAAPAVVAAPVQPRPVVQAPAATPRPVVAAAPAPVLAQAKAVVSGGWSIVSVASRYLGVPYVWGGVSPGGFDCSGLVWYAYQRAGSPIPRDMWGQYQSGTHISRANLQPGDIVFFAGTYGPGLSHDGIYIGGGRFINAADYGVGVIVSSLSNAYYANHYFGATRAW
jgi:peptidoglycan DL-endopeptidase LytF